MEIFGREPEQVRLTGLLNRVDEPVGALVLRGEAGVALVQLVRGVDALAYGRYEAAYEQLYRIFDPAEVPYLGSSCPRARSAPTCTGSSRSWASAPGRSWAVRSSPVLRQVTYSCPSAAVLR